MPTEVSPAPFRYSQQFPITLKNPMSYSKLFPSSSPQDHLPPQLQPHLHPRTQSLAHSSRSRYSTLINPWISGTMFPPGAGFEGMMVDQGRPSNHTGSAYSLGPMPSTSPARAVECIPNKVLPNGMKNPWAPYSGESYIPSNVKAENMAIDQQVHLKHPQSLAGGGGGGGRSLHPSRHRGGSVPIPIPARSLIPSTQGYQSSGWAGNSLNGGMGMGGSGSMISMNVAYGGMLKRGDDGWNGSLGRNHHGHLPDPTSQAGRLGVSPSTGGGIFQSGSPGSYASPTGLGTGFLNSPSSYRNHARMSPSLLPSPVRVPLPNSHANLPPSRLSASPQAHQIQDGEEHLNVERQRGRPRRSSLSLSDCKDCERGADFRRSVSTRSSGHGHIDEGRYGNSGRGDGRSRLASHSPVTNSPLGRPILLPEGGAGRRRRRDSGSGSSPDC